jgi:hypothetical protein
MLFAASTHCERVTMLLPFARDLIELRNCDLFAILGMVRILYHNFKLCQYLMVHIFALILKIYVSIMIKDFEKLIV